MVMASRTIELGNGQRFVIISLPEATAVLDCSIEELANWIHQGMVNNIECPTCHFTYPLQSDIKSLAGYINDFPSNVSLDEIVNERFNDMKQMRKRGGGLFGRTTSKPLPPVRQPEQRPASLHSRQQLPPLRRQHEYEDEYEQPRMRKNDGPSARTPGRR
jgi:hypothetical protein